MNEQFVEDTDNIEPVYHEQKLFYVNNQMVIDCECQEHPIRCYARNIVRKFYNPEFSHQDDKKRNMEYHAQITLRGIKPKETSKHLLHLCYQCDCCRKN